MILDGKNQTCAPAQHLLVAGVQLTLQRLLRGAATPFAVGAPNRPRVCNPPAAGRSVGCDGSVTKREGQVAVVMEKVRVVVLELLVVLKTRSQWNKRGGVENVGVTHADVGHTESVHVV